MNGLIKRNITPILWPGAEIHIQIFAASPDPIYQEISQRLVVAKDHYEYKDMVNKVISTGMYAQMGTVPWAYVNDYDDFYRSIEAILGDHPYQNHLLNKKMATEKSNVKLICHSFPNFLLLEI